MQIWPNSSNSSANGDCDSVRSMRAASESIPPVLTTLDNSIFASLITDTEEKPIVDLKSDVISDADLQIGSFASSANVGSIYHKPEPPVQTPNTYDVSTTGCTGISVSQQVPTLASLDSSSYAQDYPATSAYNARAAQLRMETFTPRYSPPTSITAASRYSLSQQQHDVFYPPLQPSYPSGQPFSPSTYPTSSNYATWPSTPALTCHSSTPTTSVITPSRSADAVGAGRCAICGSAATGIHYGALVCDSCRVFFGTAILLDVQYKCSCKFGFGDVNHYLRCHSCRLDRCFAVGMSKDAIVFEKHAAKLSIPVGHPNAFSAPPSIRPCNKVRNASASGLSPSIEITIKQISMAESIVFDVAPVNLPEGKPIFMDAKECGSLQTAVQESVINLVLWSQNIPLFSDFSDIDRFALLSSGCIELLLVHFIARLASFLTEPHSTTPPRSTDPHSHGSSSGNTSVTPSESPIAPAFNSLKIPDVVIDVLFPFHSAPEGVIFSQQAENDLRAANCWHESHILMNLLPNDADHRPASVAGVSNELSAQCPSRRLILCRLFYLAHLFKRLCLTSEAVGCLRMIILFNPEAPNLTKETRENVEKRRDEALTCLEQTFVQTDRKTAMGRMAQLCLHLADLSFVAERICSKSPSDIFPSFQCIVDVLECFYKCDVNAATAESCL